MISLTDRNTDVRPNRLPTPSRLPSIADGPTDASIAGRASEIRSEWTDIDYAVRRVDDPVEMIAQMLDRLPHC